MYVRRLFISTQSTLLYHKEEQTEILHQKCQRGTCPFSNYKSNATLYALFSG